MPKTPWIEIVKRSGGRPKGKISNQTKLVKLVKQLTHIDIMDAEQIREHKKQIGIILERLRKHADKASEIGDFVDHSLKFYLRELPPIIQFAGGTYAASKANDALDLRKAKNRKELCFKLLDAYRNNEITKEEFNNQVEAIALLQRTIKIPEMENILEKLLEEKKTI